MDKKKLAEMLTSWGCNYKHQVQLEAGWLDGSWIDSRANTHLGKPEFTLKMFMDNTKDRDRLRGGQQYETQ